MDGAFVVLTPTYRPVGGVVKVFDYVNHARSLGMQVRVHCPRAFHRGLELFESERFARMPDDDGIEFIEGYRVGIRPTDTVFFSWPTDWQHIASRIPADMAHERVIHIIQNVRHANPAWIHGYATRLLGRPMSRIMIVPQVLEAVRPFLHPDSLTEVILEGHHWPYFEKSRNGRREGPLRVGYTTWKSEVGLEVERRMGSDQRFEFRSIRSMVGWPELRELYHWADVFLATPFAEEGFYLPGLEAMAAGAIVITPDAGGNRAYCDFGVNCLAVELDEPDSYVGALDHVAGMDDSEVATMRDRATAVLANHTLEGEAAAFSRFLEAIDARVR